MSRSPKIMKARASLYQGLRSAEVVPGSEQPGVPSDSDLAAACRKGFVFFFFLGGGGGV